MTPYYYDGNLQHSSDNIAMAHQRHAGEWYCVTTGGVNNLIQHLYDTLCTQAPSDYLINYSQVNHSDGLQSKTLRLKFTGKP